MSFPTGRELNAGDENTQGHANRSRASLAYFHPRRFAGRYRRNKWLFAARTVAVSQHTHTRNQIVEIEISLDADFDKLSYMQIYLHIYFFELYISPLLHRIIRMSG